MAEVKNYRKTVKVPISVSWYQELVDDGKNGKDFYIRLSPHVNRGGKKGAPALVKKGGVFWTKTGYENARLNAELSSMAKEMEKDAIDMNKRGLIKAMNKINHGGPTQQPQTAQNATINYTHTQALERTRKQHGVLNEIDKQIDKDIAETYKGQSAEDIMKTYGTTDEEKERVKILLGQSTAGYDAVMKVYNETKVGDDDDYYDL